jgi:hypothetical protein
MSNLKDLLSKLIELAKSIFKEVEAIEKSQSSTTPKVEKSLEQQAVEFIEEIIHAGKTNPLTKTAYMNFRESEGYNRSKDIDPMILRNGGTLGIPYCMFGQQDILRAVEKKFNVKFDLPKTGSTQKFWADTKAIYKTQTPVPYSIGIYQKGDLWKGHAVQCRGSVNSKEFATFEFNTSPDAGPDIVRDGQGCYFKVRPLSGYGDMKLKGFVDIFKAMRKL